MNWLERKIVPRPGLWLLGPVGLAILLSPAIGFAQPGRGYTPPPYTPPPYTPPPQNFNAQNFAQQQQMRTQQETQNRNQDDASRRMDQFRSSNQQDAFRTQRDSEQSRRSSPSSSGGANPNGGDSAATIAPTGQGFQCNRLFTTRKLRGNRRRCNVNDPNERFIRTDVQNQENRNGMSNRYL